MKMKLTVRLEERLARAARERAARRGKTLSAMVADILALFQSGKGADDAESLPPTVRSLKGALKGAHVDEADHLRHLERKHR